MEAFLATLGVFVFLFLFCISLLDIALRSVNYTKINSIRRQGNKSAQKLFSLLSSPESAISVLLFLRYTHTAFLYLLAGTILALSGLPTNSKILLVPVIILVLLILLEYVPRMLAVQNPERVAFTMVKPFEWIVKINNLVPIPKACERLASRLLRVYGFNGQKIFSEYSVNEIKMFLSMGRTRAELDLRRQTIDTKFIDFSGRRVREVMVPRPFVKALEINTPLRQILASISENRYSRMPVFRSSLDNILGILHVKDVIAAVEPFSLEGHLRKPFFIPESATVQAAFQDMRRNRAHIAVVVDEYGGVEGIVTLEDLIEELVGEIHDEYDEDVEMLHKVNDGLWVLEGNLQVKELNQNLGLDLPEDPSYTTIAGFLISILDKIPAEKEQIRYGALVFTVEKMLGNKIARVSLRMPLPARETSPH